MSKKRKKEKKKYSRAVMRMLIDESFRVYVYGSYLILNGLHQQLLDMPPGIAWNCLYRASQCTEAAFGVMNVGKELELISKAGQWRKHIDEQRSLIRSRFEEIAANRAS